MPPDPASTWLSVADQVQRHLTAALRGDRATADDLAQEVFLRLRRSLPTLRHLDRLGAWVRRLTRSVLIDHLRRQRPMQDLTGYEPSSAAVAAAGPDGLATFVRDQVDHLPTHEAAAIRLVDLAGAAPQDAARTLGITHGALKARLRRGRGRLRQAIDRCCAVVLDGRGAPLACEPTAASTCTSC